MERKENFSEQELNFGTNHQEVDSKLISKILTYSEYKSILCKLKLISGSEVDKDEKYLTIQLYEDIKDKSEEDLNYVLADTLCEVLIIILGMNTAQQYSNLLLDQMLSDKSK